MIFKQFFIYNFVFFFKIYILYLKKILNYNNISILTFFKIKCLKNIINKKNIYIYNFILFY